jgi:ABC-type branched-subunit amino acid transport system substrate-binding protein
MVSDLKRGDAIITASGIFGTIESLSEKFVTVEIADGVVIISPSIKTTQDFSKNYFETYKETPNYVTTRNYDAMKLVLDSFNVCTKDDQKECIKNYVASIKYFPGLVAPVNFDQNGDLIDQYQISIAQDSKFTTR